ncbi:MAG: potassium transporter TrkA [Lentisphaerae bacterium GWF2_45_14]|nr:MAG: potassium transporter TrkA [Lentisphaerae bacterium GWF2_45_14]
MIAIASLLVVMAISLLTMRLAAMALILTGMSRESARFQARSALAGVGFTTKEAEMVVNHPVRRRIIMVLMLIGSIGVPTVVASIVISFVTTAQAEYWWKPMSLLVGGLAALTILARSRWAERRLNKWLAWALKRWTDLDVRDYVSLLQLQNGYAVTEMLVKSNDWLEGKTLQDAALSHEGVLILAILRQDGEYIGTPRAADTIHAKDVLVLYGLIERLRELDQRTASAGESAHQEAISEYVTQAAEQKMSSNASEVPEHRDPKSQR